MRVGLNATCFNERASGAKQRFIGIYGELIRRLPGTEFIVYEPEDCKVSSWFSGSGNVTPRLTPLPSDGRVKRLVKGLGYWPQIQNLDGLDLFECFNLPLTHSRKVRTVLTIHDIRGVYLGRSALQRLTYRLALKREFNRTDHIITVSESMKQEIIDIYPCAEISVVRNGIDVKRFDDITTTDCEIFRGRYNLPKEPILSVGHFEQRKNYLRLIDALAKLRDEGQDLNLVIVGNDSGERKRIQERIDASNLNQRVTLLSGLSDLEVRCAYKLASLFVFPSSYEGFGIPILEAMAAGCPMVLSDIPVFREITQNRGIYFPFDDVDALAESIGRILSSSSQREKSVGYGKERVEAFTFKTLAEQMESVYRKLIV